MSAPSGRMTCPPHEAQSDEERDRGEQDEGVRGGAGEHGDAGDDEDQNREATAGDEVAEGHHERRDRRRSRPG